MSKPRIAAAPVRIAMVQGQRFARATGNWRTDNMTAADRGYGHKWRTARAGHLRSSPLCVMCLADAPSRLVRATVVDHKIPHRGDMALFWDSTNWQSLCTHHHSSAKQKQDRAGAA